MIQELFRDITEVLQSHAMKLGRFDNVFGAEPKAKPGTGVNAAIWVQSFYPRSAPHGLATTSMVLTMTFRVYTDLFAEHPDVIDPRMMEAVGQFITLVSADFTLDGMSNVQAVDLAGAFSNGLGGQAGYAEISGTMFRIFTVDIPIILNDVFEQVA